MLVCSAEIFQWEECLFTCPKLNKAQIPPSNSLEELEDFRQWSNKFVNIPGRPATTGAIWTSLTDAVEEGVWRDHYTGQEVDRDVLELEVGGLKENTEQNCGVVG